MLAHHLGGLPVVEVIKIVEVKLTICAKFLPSGAVSLCLHTSTEHGRISVSGRQADTAHPYPGVTQVGKKPGAEISSWIVSPCSGGSSSSEGRHRSQEQIATR